MTKDEFNRWLQDYQVRFPDTANWISAQANTQDMLEVWREAMTSVDVRDALEVNRRLTRGDDEHWPAYEREETPAKIRKLAWEVARTRKQFEPNAETLARQAIVPVAFPIGILFRQLVEVNERWAKNPDFDKYAEHARLKAEFLAKYSAKPLKNRETAFDAYNAS